VNDLGAGPQIQFSTHVRAVHLDCLPTQIQPLGDLPGVQALADELEDLELPVGKPAPSSEISITN